VKIGRLLHKFSAQMPILGRIRPKPAKLTPDLSTSELAVNHSESPTRARLSQLFEENRSKRFFKRNSVMLPSSWIRKFQKRASPICPFQRADYICCDRANNYNYDFRAKLFKSLAETNFAVYTSPPALVPG
jgi:hypothetical protein